MTVPKVELRCPFCHTVLAPHVTVCHRCRARRHTRKGMSPRGFHLFFATWLALAVPVMALACYVGFAPWAPGGLPPAYALAIIGAKPSAQELVRCRVEVVEPDGRKTVKLLDGECRGGAATAKPAGEAQPSPTEQRLATALHSALSLLGGLLASWALMPLVRRAFLRRADPSWVRRAAT
jgi:hypothetical protein